MGSKSLESYYLSGRTFHLRGRSPTSIRDARRLWETDVINPIFVGKRQRAEEGIVAR